MIGQKKLLAKIDRLVESGFPRFVLLFGTKGSGKKLMCKEIANKLNYPLVPIGTTVEEVREVISNSYNNTEDIVYVLPDTDKMSVQAKNALLKVTEEPPQKAHFILTVTNLANTLPTLISRACLLPMDVYTEEELYGYYCAKYDGKLDEDLARWVCNVAVVPEEVDILMSYDVKEFMNFVELTAENLHTVSSANAFKLQNKLALKKDEDKWDVLLFLQALKYTLLHFYKASIEPGFLDVYFEASKVVKEIKTKNSVNKQYCLDQFILAARECWRKRGQ